MTSEQAPGEWLREQLERRNLTAHDVSRAVGLRDQAVYYWLTGRTTPKDEAAAKLAELLGIPVVEVRRRFGLWVPEAVREDRPSIDQQELAQLRSDLQEILNRIDRLQGDGPGSGGQ